MNPFVSLEPFDDAMPMYQRIYSAVSESILSGRLSPGTRLPSTRSLAAELGISRMTVTNAYDQLLAEGYLEGRHGSGTFVAAHLPEEFLRIEKRSSGQPSQRLGPRPTVSEYGLYLKENAGIIADHHTPSRPKAFQHSIPALDKFPFDLWSKIVQKKLKYSWRAVSGYGEAMGFGPLRRAVAEHLRGARGVECDEDQVMITAGTQQAIYLIGRVLLAKNDTVWLEDPCHLGAHDAFAANSVVQGVPVDESGFDIEAANARFKKARLIYVTPSRQFPLGVTMSLERRLTLLEWARDNDAWIIEDDYDSEFRYASRPLPSLQGLDRASRVLYVGTFSKTLFPGLRLGCLVLPADLVDVFAAARSLVDLNGPLIDQVVLAEFIAEGHFERHVRRMRALYRERQEMLVSETAKRLSGLLDVAAADAGMHLIGWLPRQADNREISLRAREIGVLAAPVSRYAAVGWKRPGLLLGYTAFDEREIRTGVENLAKVLEPSDLAN